MKKIILKIVTLTIIICIVLSVKQVKATVNDVCGIDDLKTYYIKNLYNGKYLSVLNGTDANGTDVYTTAFSGAQSQKWKVNRNNDGSYAIQAVVSTNNRVLDISGTNVDIWVYNSSLSCQKFTLVRNETMAYGGTYNIKNGSNYVVVDISTDSAVKSSVGSGLNALWSFEPVYKGEAKIHTFYYPEGTIWGSIPSYFDTTGPVNTFIGKCGNMGYSSSNLTNTSAINAYGYLDDESIWVFYGHGLSSNDHIPLATVCFKNGNGDDSGYLTANSNLFNRSIDRAIDSLQNNSLSSERCVLYMGCSTGCDYLGYNLVDSTFNKGAHFSLGTTETINIYQGTNWINKFFEKADTGATIRQCIDYANYNINLGLLYYKGDTFAKLK